MLVLPHPDWLHHHLWVIGEPGEVMAFRAAAAGAGVIPWQHDLGPAAEDWFHLPPAPGRGTPRMSDSGPWRVGFWLGDWTPWRTIQQLGAR